MVVALAVIVANIPFLVERRLLVIPSVHGKTFGFRLLEVALGYGIVGGIALVIEASSFGSAYPQRWEFFALTVCLFLVFAFPGFVYRYLWRGKIA